MLNTLTTQEYVALKATLITMENKRFDCNHCLNFKYPGNEKKIGLEKKVLGCTERAPVPHKHENMQFHRCVGNYYSDACAAWVEASIVYDKGIMPFDGGYFTQPAKALEVIRVISNFRLQREAEKAKKAQFKGVKRGRKRG